MTADADLGQKRAYVRRRGTWSEMVPPAIGQYTYD